jgi:hypothetical protein
MKPAAKTDEKDGGSARMKAMTLADSKEDQLSMSPIHQV